MAKAKRQKEIAELRARLTEAEETLNAIRRGEVDALVVSDSTGEQIYTLRGADYSSSVFLQEMNEGAVTMAPDGTILYCNPRFAEMIALPHEKIIGAAANAFVAPKNRQLFEALLREGEKGRTRASVDFLAADGSVVPAYLSVNPVNIGQMQCLCMVATDLTDQKRKEKILASERLAYSILDQAAEIIVVCDGSGIIIRASRAAQEFFGRNILYEPFNELFQIINGVGEQLHCANEAAAADQPSTLLDGCLGGKRVLGLEVRLRRPDGRMGDFLMSAAPLHDSQEQVMGCVFTFSNVSAMKNVEAALRENERQLREQSQQLEQQLIASGRLVSLGEITASMAHEFNNPLGIIMGFIDEMLRSKEPSDPDYRALQIVDEESRRCQKIIRDLMDYARPRSAEMSWLTIPDLIDRTLNLVENHLYKQKIARSTDIQADLPQIYADFQQLTQVLVNLYLNAIDAMPNGGKLQIAAKFEAANGAPPGIVITVADTGHGIGAEELSRVFHPFYTARKRRGLGLGLPISRRIVNNHGGEITVESQVNEGSAFKISLPLKPAADEPPVI